jgi:hypothetical protein
MRYAETVSINADLDLPTNEIRECVQIILEGTADVLLNGEKVWSWVVGLFVARQRNPTLSWPHCAGGGAIRRARKKHLVSHARHTAHRKIE